jgi:ribose 1,5-bisphosphokinase
MKGRLFYVVGASGAGKDSLIQYAREKLGAHGAVVFAHRYITRAPHSRGENHIALSESEFILRERNGLFALAWHSHGHHYGIGIEIDHWLERSLDVVVNGSRGYLAVARARYAELRVVWINAKPQVLAARLQHRGRESGSQIIARLARAARPSVAPPPDAVQISNDGPLEHAGDRLVDVLSGKP